MLNQNVFPAVAIIPDDGDATTTDDDNFVAAYNMGSVVMVDQWDGIAWTAVTSFTPSDVGLSAFGDDLDLDIDSNGDLHVAFTGYVSSVAPGSTRVVYYGMYDVSTTTWTFNEIANYTHGSGHINPDDPQVECGETAGSIVYSEIEWTVRDASVVAGGRHELHHAIQTTRGTLGAWATEVIHTEEGPAAAITNSVFVIENETTTHSSFIARPAIDAGTPDVIPLRSLWYGKNDTTVENFSFNFMKIREGSAATEPAKANSIDLSAAGDVHIAYHDNVDDSLHHITDASGAFSDVGADEVVDSLADTDIGRRCDIDVNAIGEILISYQDHTNKALKTALLQGGSLWHIMTIANDGNQNGRYIGSGLNVFCEIMITHDAKLAENDKRLLYAFSGVGDNLPLVEDITADLTVSTGRLQLNRRTGELSAVITVTNPVGAIDTHFGPFTVVLTLSSPAVSVVNADGTTPGGDPLFDLSSEIGFAGLAPGEMQQFTAIFDVPGRVRFTFEAAIFALAP